MTNYLFNCPYTEYAPAIVVELHVSQISAEIDEYRD